MPYRIQNLGMTAAILLAIGAGASAQPFDLSWNTIDGGGFMFSTGGGYELGGTIGQPDAGGPMTGGGYELIGGFWAGALVVPPAGPSLVSAVSRRTHGAVGDFDIPLPLEPASAGIECRLNGPLQIVLTFSDNIKAADNAPDGTEVSVAPATLVSVGISGSEMTINLNNAPNGSCLAVVLSGITSLSGVPLSGDSDVHVRCLAGDANGDGQVASGDITQVKAVSGQLTSASNFRRDANADGIVASGDITIVKARSGNAVNPCP
jgi:hypothetical protein